MEGQREDEEDRMGVVVRCLRVSYEKSMFSFSSCSVRTLYLDFSLRYFYLL